MQKFDITFIQGQTKINADWCNWVTSTLNELVERVSGDENWRPYVDSVSNVENSEFSAIYVDANDKLIYGVRIDGTIYNPNIDADETDQSYNGAVVSDAIDYMETNNRPQTSLV